MDRARRVRGLPRHLGVPAPPGAPGDGNKERHQLVTAGPYRFVRHPLYLDGIVLFASIGLMADNWFILLFTALVVIGVRAVIIPQEEENLIAAFGDAYRDYRTATGALLPAAPRGGRHG